MAKYKAFGTVLQRFNGVSFDDVAQVRDISGPSLSSETVDVTSHDSTGGYREHLATLKDGGEISIDALFDPALSGHTDVLGDLGGDPVLYRIVWPNTGTNTIWECSSIVTGFEPTAPYEGELAVSVSLKVTGQPDFAAT